MKRQLGILPVVLLLAACGSGTSDAPVADEGAVAGGEVLDGSISDAMIPHDQIRSQSPRAEPEASEGGSSAAAPAAKADGDESQAETDPAPANTDADADTDGAEE